MDTQPTITLAQRRAAWVEMRDLYESGRLSSTSRLGLGMSVQEFALCMAMDQHHKRVRETKRICTSNTLVR